MSAEIEDILAFWFSNDMRTHWFQSTPEIDTQIHTRFASTWERARQRQLEHWSNTAQGSLALIIVLDQFPLNMYRGQAISYAGGDDAVRLAKMAIDRGQDASLKPEQRMFMYLPFMHSEVLAHQDESLRLFAAAGLEKNLAFARHHRDIIKRFGRFPHRNAVLGRQSTKAERRYLHSDEAFKG